MLDSARSLGIYMASSMLMLWSLDRKGTALQQAASIPEGDARHAMQAGVGVLLEAGLSVLAMALHKHLC